MRALGNRNKLTAFLFNQKPNVTKQATTKTVTREK